MSRAFALIIFLQSFTSLAQTTTSKEVLNLMGSRFELVAVHENKALRELAIRDAIAEIERIESLISSWDPNSETSHINANAGIQPINVSEELFNLIERAIKISNLTNGAFDISFSSLDPIWIFDGRRMAAPDSSQIASSVHKINYNNIELNRQKLTVYLRERGMKIGFGAIGKGYAANRAKKIMIEHEILHGLVNAGGDLVAWGNQESGEPWKIGIADPRKEQEYLAWLNISDMSVVTSGNYEKYVIIEEHKFGHIINPKTGWPVTGIQSVTIVSPDTELSDALATSVFVLGIEVGIDLVNQLKYVEALIIDDQNKIWTSDHLDLNYY